MTKAIEWPGKSGKKYRYHFVDMGQPFETIAGNYCFAKQLANGNFVPLYFGETSDFENRMPGHDVWAKALVLGATHAMAHSTLGGVEVRRAEERDLIQKWNPTLNTQYRTTG